MEKEKNNLNCQFIKNQYYPGKLLHATDFVNEQEYGNRKIEFLNRQFFGCGIIEGLNVNTGKDGQLILKAGSALDGQGRILLVPEDTQVAARQLEGLEGIDQEDNRDFVLGILYAEKEAGKERSFLSKEEVYAVARVAESYTLKAYPWSEWCRLREEREKATGSLTQERILYEDEDIRLTVKAPRIVPSDSLFAVRIQAQVLNPSGVNIGWRGRARLQGAWFPHTGGPSLTLESKQGVLKGNYTREWEVCTEQGRNLPLTLELEAMDITVAGRSVEQTETCQFRIEAMADYEAAVREMDMLTDTVQSVAVEEDWIPLAHLRVEKGSEGGDILHLHRDSEVRIRTVNPGREAAIRRMIQENGIVDIRWRELLSDVRPMPPEPGPIRPQPPEPGPIEPGPIEPGPPGRLITEEQLRELLEKDRESRIRRGITVIPIPKRYRRGQVLYSEEIQHGFPREEVFLWCARVQEERNYAYWNRSKMQYSLFSGQENLFAEGREQRGWGIEKQALRQDVEKGTFRIGITLDKRGRRKQEEVAISWIAIRSI